jgi:hypothetical protein
VLGPKSRVSSVDYKIDGCGLYRRRTNPGLSCAQGASKIQNMFAAAAKDYSKQQQQTTTVNNYNKQERDNQSQSSRLLCSNWSNRSIVVVHSIRSISQLEHFTAAAAKHNRRATKSAAAKHNSRPPKSAAAKHNSWPPKSNRSSSLIRFNQSVGWRILQQQQQNTIVDRQI